MKTKIAIVHTGFSNVEDACWFDLPLNQTTDLCYDVQEIDLPCGWSLENDGIANFGLTCYDPEGNIAEAWRPHNGNYIEITSAAHYLKYKINN